MHSWSCCWKTMTLQAYGFWGESEMAFELIWNLPLAKESLVPLKETKGLCWSPANAVSHQEISSWRGSAVVQAEEAAEFVLTNGVYRDLVAGRLQLEAQRGSDRQSRWFMSPVSYTEMWDATFVLSGDIILPEIRLCISKTPSAYKPKVK